jgi:hypothetical protein
MRDTSTTMETYEEPRASLFKRILLSCIHGVAKAFCNMQRPWSDPYGTARNILLKVRQPGLS